MLNARVLVVDDSPEMLATIQRYLTDHHWQVHTAVGGAEALAAFAREPVDVVLTDLRMKGTDGLAVLEGVRRVDPYTPVVLMTAFGSVESAVEAIQRGAYNYVTKPFKMAQVRACLEKAVEDIRRPDPAGEAFVGSSAASRELAALVQRVARTSTPVLIIGETGTGKELVARAIHQKSDRSAGPFVAVSCAALPETAFESELFGKVGKVSEAGGGARRGLFAEAHRGTLFLDEVADLPLALQGKLLRVLESGEIRAVGDDTPRKVDVRCIASTRADLPALVRAKLFRDDLYFRLDVVPVRMVPLRERRDDLPQFVDYLLARAQERAKEPRPRRLTSAAYRLLEEHDWPGNVRQLENLLQRLLVTTTDAEIDADAVRAALAPLGPRDPAEALAAAQLSLQDVEERYVEAVLRQSNGNKVDAAAILGIDLSTLYRRRARKRR